MRIIHDMGEGAHKLGRIFLAAVTTIVMGWIIKEVPDISVEKLILIASVPVTYILRKGQGYTPKQDDAADKNPVTEKDFE